MLKFTLKIRPALSQHGHEYGIRNREIVVVMHSQLQQKRRVSVLIKITPVILIPLFDSSGCLLISAL